MYVKVRDSRSIISIRGAHKNAPQTQRWVWGVAVQWKSRMLLGGCPSCARYTWPSSPSLSALPWPLSVARKRFLTNTIMGCDFQFYDFYLSSIFVLFSTKTPFTLFPFPFYCHCICGIIVATISASKWGTIVLVVVSLTTCKRLTHDVELCPWLIANMSTITITSIYHCNYVLQS